MMKEELSSSETSVLKRVTGKKNQKIPFFIVTAVKTLNLIFDLFVYLMELKCQLNAPAALSSCNTCIFLV
jgi:hypothetical protein